MKQIIMCNTYKGVNITKYGVKVEKPNSIQVLKNNIDVLKDAKVIEEKIVLNDRKDSMYTLVKTCEELAKEVSKLEKPIIIGGDHSIALGSIKGVAKQNDGPDEKLGIIWIDSHGDFNTGDTTPTGNIHGMPLSALAGLGYSELVNVYKKGQAILPRNIVILGTRDLDDEEEVLLNENGVKFYPYNEVVERGLDKVLKEINEYLQVERLHISFDLDSMDPEIIKGVCIPVKAGFNEADIYQIFDYFNANKNICSIDIVEYNSDNDDGHTLEFIKSLLQTKLNY